jgi:hypothetical protein
MYHCTYQLRKGTLKQLRYDVCFFFTVQFYIMHSKGGRDVCLNYSCCVVQKCIYDSSVKDGTSLSLCFDKLTMNLF